MTNTKLLEQLIKERGLKKAYIAKKLGLSRAGLCNLLNNRSEFRASQIQALTELLDLTEAQRNAVFFTVAGV